MRAEDTEEFTCSEAVVLGHGEQIWEGGEAVGDGGGGVKEV